MKNLSALISTGMLVAGLFLPGTPAVAAQDPDMGVATQVEGAGPHGGTVLQGKTTRVEVVIDRKNEKVDLFVLKDEKNPLRPLSITLFKDSESGSEVELKSLPSESGSPQFQGALRTEVKPVVGMVIHFQLPGGKKTQLHAPKVVVHER